MQPRLYGFILKRLADRDQTLEVLQRINLVTCQKLPITSQVQVPTPGPSQLHDFSSWRGEKISQEIG